MKPLSRRDAVKALSVGTSPVTTSSVAETEDKKGQTRKDRALMRVRHYTTGKVGGDLLPIPVVPASDWEYVIIYSIELLKLQPGEFLMVTAQNEVESKILTNVLIASQLVLADKPTGKAKDDLIIAPATGTNIVNRPEGGGVYQHYYVATSIGSLAITQPAARKFVNFVAYAASDAEIPPTERFLYARPYAGSMTVLRFST